MAEKESPNPTSSSEIGFISEVRYSLPEILRELRVERSASAFSMEMLDQVEIAKTFQGRKTRRAKSKK